MAFLLHKTRFLTTVNEMEGLLNSFQPEVAFAGRSNAGKSSAINVLCNQRQLAYASKTPGRTQHINYFSIGEADDPVGFLVDLPGYGYAKVSKDVKKHWHALLNEYLQTRVQLRGLILLMDARHPCTDLDLQMMEWFLPTRKSIHILLTKADKLTRQESVTTLRKTENLLNQYNNEKDSKLVSVQLFSSLKRTGLETAHEMIESWFIPKEI